MTNSMIYKVLRPAEWEALQTDGQTTGAPIDLADGYIHFSTATQLAETLAKHFVDASPLIVLGVEEAKAGAKLAWEPSRGGALFPHLYRPLEMEDVARFESIEIKDGLHVLPPWIL